MAGLEARARPTLQPPGARSGLASSPRLGDSWRSRQPNDRNRWRFGHNSFGGAAARPYTRRPVLPFPSLTNTIRTRCRGGLQRTFRLARSLRARILEASGAGGAALAPRQEPYAAADGLRQTRPGRVSGPQEAEPGGPRIVGRSESTGAWSELRQLRVARGARPASKGSPALSAVLALGVSLCACEGSEEPAQSNLEPRHDALSMRRSSQTQPFAAEYGDAGARGRDTAPTPSESSAHYVQHLPRAAGAADASLEQDGGVSLDAGSLDAGVLASDDPDPEGLDAGGPTGEASADASADAGSGPPRYFFTGECEGVFVYIVTVSVEHPEESTASLSLTSSGTGRVRSVGDRIGSLEVMRIDEDWTGLNPKVWLRERDTVCYATLAGNETRKAAARKRRAASRKKAAARKRAASKRRAKARRQREARKRKQAARRRKQAARRRKKRKQ